MKTMLSSWELNASDLQLIDLALNEDLSLPYHDITTSLLFPNLDKQSHATIISKHPSPIVICGLPVIKAILAKLGDCKIESEFSDGQLLQPGGTLLTITGPAQRILMAERVMLNFLQHLCAVATLTAQYVNKVSHTKTKILDTRKTLPGFRHLDKYAVQCGGGVNHRLGLYDAIMVKDTHIDALGGMAIALASLPDASLRSVPVIVEVRTQDELRVVLEQGLHKVTRVLLDNMSTVQLSECVVLLNGRIATEASGNMNLETIAEVAECGVDAISVGKITHSAGNVDLSMKSGF